MNTMNSQLNNWVANNGLPFTIQPQAEVELKRRKNSFARQLETILNAEAIKPFPVGSIVMGVDRSYPRSHYEVLGSSTNGRMSILLFRRLRHENGCVSDGDDFPESRNIMIRPTELFAIETDHLLKPTIFSIDKMPADWLHEDSWEISSPQFSTVRHVHTSLF
jgi:hypothetical protein